MEAFLVAIGCVLGILGAAVRQPASVWLVQLTLFRGAVAAASAVLAFAVVTGLWTGLAAGGLLSIGNGYWSVDVALRILSAVALILLMRERREAPELESLELPADEIPAFRHTLPRALIERGQLIVSISLIVMLGLPLRVHDPMMAIPYTLGVVIGSICWGLFFVVVAKMGRQVPVPIFIRSLRKLRSLSMALLGLFVVISIGAIAGRFIG